MHILLVALQVLFFVPLIARAAVMRGGGGIGPEFVAGFLKPRLVIHGAGNVLLWVGVAEAVVNGRVPAAPTFRGVLGAALIIAGTLLVTWAVVAFRSWRLLPTIDAEHELCTAGPFRFVRHPIYLALDLLGIGSAIWVGTPLVIASVAFFVLGGDLRARSEERALLQAFGDRYRSYMRQVRRTIPFLY
ncbi:MAG TPA: isoprenylcysteine carboxylmethyltransferase family protein [Myxococcales bacterium]|nr:isoprenylcysteine carboxylmethyltransferase family protein [Myxococcales bacterium]